MNKILVSLLIAIGAIGAAEAGGPNNGGNYNRGGNTYVNNNNYYRGGGGYYRGYNNNYNWVAPALIGGAIGAAITAPYFYTPLQPNTYVIPGPVTSVYAQPQVIVVPEPAPVYTNTVQTNNQCPYPERATYNRVYTTDRFGNNIQVDQFVGCR